MSTPHVQMQAGQLRPTISALNISPLKYILHQQPAVKIIVDE